MTDTPFVSRRDAREAERTGRVSPPVAAVEVPTSEIAAVKEPEKSVAPAEASFNFPPLTNSQLVQMGRIAENEDSSGVSKEVTSVQVAPTSVIQISTTGIVNPYAPKVATPPAAEAKTKSPAQENIQSSPAQPYEAVLAEAEEPITSQLPLFAVSPNLNIEPQTASIIIDNFEPLDNISIAISETGEMLKTGSIELPNLSTNTGEIATILDAAEVDEAIAQDSVAGYVSTIAPLRASGVVNTAGKIGIMPSRKARGEGGGFVALTLSILMVTIGGLVLAAFMLGILK
ncbi:MAG: hypothetical protein RLY34_388 [Actinomycetota bacterium]|jgi:hypothetical protein